MKTLLLSLFLFSGLLAIPGTEDPVVPYRTGLKIFFVTRVENFVDDTKEACDSYSGRDWRESQKYFGKLIKDYSEYYSSLSQEKKNRVNKALGKYVGMTFKAGVDVSIDVLKEIYRRAPSVLEGVYEGSGLKDLFESN
ncbi:MAG: hypothetical protein PHF43_05615 [Bacteroidales bacterium]|jgi:hypothetical protein|nr:hypothetical protein [Bacteroidales bacterium]MDD5283588.1 hypothetical protein [Bacteroidales bacterium]NLF81484.1 hypothetical protein [Bacteroidales bacterium]